MKNERLGTLVGLARLTLLEARRTAVARGALTVIVVAFGLAVFMDRIVLTDQERVTVVTYAAVVRVALLLLVAQAIIANTVRDLNEHTVEHFLALPLTRLQYALGKWLGWAAVALIGATAAALPLLGFTDTPARLPWALSFAAEALVVQTLALLLALLLGRILTAMLAFCCLYLFARVSHLLIVLSHNMGANQASLGERFDARYLELASYLVPRLDLFADSGWLAGNTVRFGPDLLQGAVYIALLGAVAGVELRRKQF